MTFKWLLAGVMAVFALQISSNAQTFECPKHFAEAQAQIDKVAGDMGGKMSKMMPKSEMALVHALLDDAKMRLAAPNTIIRSHAAASTTPAPSPRPTRRSATPGPPTSCTSK